MGRNGKADLFASNNCAPQEYHVRVLDRAIAILGALRDASGPLGDVELADKLDLHKSTIHRLLAVLDRNGFVERKPGSAKYSLGAQLIDLGIVAQAHLNLLERARPHVARLAKETGETAHMSLLRQQSVVSMVAIEGHHALPTPATVGRRTPFHCVSQGKAIVAFLPEKDVERLLDDYDFKPHTSNTITGRERFIAELALVRDRGYAVDNEEFEEGLRCVAAPVFDASGAVRAAIGIAGPRFRVNGTQLPILSQSVMQSAARLSIPAGAQGQQPRPV